MARHSKKLDRKYTDDAYLALVRALPLRPIRSDVELDRAIAMIDSLIDRDELNADEEDYLDVLSDLVHRYEAEHDPIAPVADAEMIRFLLESNDDDPSRTRPAERDRSLDNLGNPGGETKAEPPSYRGGLSSFSC